MAGTLATKKSPWTMYYVAAVLASCLPLATSISVSESALRARSRAQTTVWPVMAGTQLHWTCSPDTLSDEYPVNGIEECQADAVAAGLTTFSFADNTNYCFLSAAGCDDSTFVKDNPSNWHIYAGTASATGDPHLQNIHGERFDLTKLGNHVLVHIPRGGRVEDALLRVQAEARQLGDHCDDIYFQSINISGSWAEAGRGGGYRYVASQQVIGGSKWLPLGKAELKVVHGHTQGGIQYLNLYVKHLGRVGFVVGGLLGEDDHADVTVVPAACVRRVVLRGLHKHSVGSQGEAPAQSVAVASSE